MDIEQVAEESPQDIFTQAIDINTGIQDHHTERIGKLLGLQGKVLQDAQDQMKKLYKLMLATDSVQIEINPFVVASDGKVYCVDAKLNFDENAQFRQEKIFSMRDWSMEDPREVQAAKFNLNYIGLDGNIGCMVNGAGLAMATMDIIKLHGGQPANFLDVGGGASAKQVEEAFKILSSDKSVKAILVNIFGGIMKCDVIADGIVAAAKAVGIRLPLVVRLEGTNVDKGNKILRESGIRLTTASDFDDAAIKAVKAIS
jgi:succinyl-CoA synthetase beta subunit